MKPSTKGYLSFSLKTICQAKIENDFIFMFTEKVENDGYDRTLNQSITTVYTEVISLPASYTN